MLPGSATNQTPYFSLTGTHPHVEGLTVFGCRYYARKKGDRPHKLDYNTSTSIFLGFTGIAKNVYYYNIDLQRGQYNHTTGCPDPCLTSSHQSGVSTRWQKVDGKQESQASPIARIQLWLPNAKILTQGSVLAARYDVYSTTYYHLTWWQNSHLVLWLYPHKVLTYNCIPGVD